ncbi:MAG: tetratricopeptide repeat protein [Planctomycetaceae bacterium]
MAAVSETLRTAVGHHRAGRLAEAETLYCEIVRAEPAHADALHLLGVAAHQRGDHERAVELIRRAVAAKPGFAPFHGNLGAAYRSLGRLDEAIASYEVALKLEPNAGGIHFNLGNVLMDREAFDDASCAYRRAVELEPQSAEFWNGLGAACLKRELFEEAVQAHRQAVELSPRDPDSRFRLGTSLRGAGRFSEAAAEFLRAVSLKPDYLDAHTNLGAVYDDLGDLNSAKRAYDRALMIDSCSPPARFNRALALLRKGEFHCGWAEYEWRWKHNGRPRQFAQPVWDGCRKDGTVLVYSEQGIGDEILFASCVPDVLARADRCVLECDGRLMRLFARSFPEADVIGKVGGGGTPPVIGSKVFDSQIAIGSLPKLFRSSIAAFPKGAYLRPDGRKVEEWRRRYVALDRRLNVGISWRGGKDPAVRRMRSTLLAQWKPVLDFREIAFINLQYGECRDEIRDVEHAGGRTIHDWEIGNPLGDLDEFAARVAALDLVISVDNSTVHLAGALGIPVWVLLPGVSDWRWMIEGEDSLWYPRVRLFRTARAETWNDVFRRVASELSSTLRERIGVGGAE